MREQPSYLPRIALAVLTLALWSTGLGWKVALGLLVGVLLHEWGHMLAANACGQKPEPMWIHPLGGFVKVDMHNLRDIQRVTIGLAGPALGLVGVIGFLLISPLDPSLSRVAYLCAMLNLVNLLPAFPLDGGHAFRGSVRPFVDRPFLAIATANAVCATIFFFVGKNFDGVAILLYGLIATMAEYQMYTRRTTNPLESLREDLFRRMTRSQAKVAFAIYGALFVTLAVLAHLLQDKAALPPIL